MTATIKTKIHVFSFDTHSESGRAAWNALWSRLENEHRAGLRPKPSRHASFPEQNAIKHFEKLLLIDNQEVELETDHLFGDQWNTPAIEGVTESGLRVFDCDIAEMHFFGGRKSGVIRGHFLEQTQEMRDLRDNTLVCGYCGKHHPKEGAPVFCDKCLDSEYLQEKDLKLLRLYPVSRRWAAPYPELTEAEKAELAPRFYEAQAHGQSERGKVRAAKARADVLAKTAKKIANAEAERDGTLWLLDHGVNVGNVIYYDHTATFSFGWRTPLDPGTLSRVLDIISEFRWPYEIKCADGRKLEGNKG